ncbi:hypothetical protein Hanom_Chr09g00832421 [Helianthus anomalus]
MKLNDPIITTLRRTQSMTVSLVAHWGSYITSEIGSRKTNLAPNPTSFQSLSRRYSEKIFYQF